MRRGVAALGAVLLLALPLSGCGGKDKVASSGGSGSGAASSSSPSTSRSATILSASPSETASTEDGPPSTSPSAAGGSGVNSCSIITPDMVNQAFDTSFAAGVSEPSTFGDPNTTDCLFQGSSTDLVLAEGTSRASQDLSQTSIGNASLLPGAQSIPDADRGYVYVLSSTPSGSVGNVVMVKGEKGFNITVSVTRSLDVDSLQGFAKSILAAIS